MLPLATLTKAAECLKTLAHPHRLYMLQLLLKGKYTVGELAKASGIQSHVASEHLRVMKDRGYLTSSREGQKVFYSVAEPALANILKCIEERFGKRSSKNKKL